jgi:CDGSH-type Zn-finger protein
MAFCDGVHSRMVDQGQWKRMRARLSAWRESHGNAAVEVAMIVELEWGP